MENRIDQSKLETKAILWTCTVCDNFNIIVSFRFSFVYMERLNRLNRRSISSVWFNCLLAEQRRNDCIETKRLCSLHIQLGALYKRAALERIRCFCLSHFTSLNIDHNLGPLKHQVNRMLIRMNSSSNLVVFSTVVQMLFLVYCTGHDLPHPCALQWWCQSPWTEQHTALLRMSKWSQWLWHWMIPIRKTL